MISPVTGGNCSVRFLNSPIQDACLNQTWVHNPAAYDPDGDSLSYEPAVCLGLGGLPIVGYDVSRGPTTASIRSPAPSRGMRPSVAGEYNIAFIVREWRTRSMAHG